MGREVGFSLDVELRADVMGIGTIVGLDEFDIGTDEFSGTVVLIGRLVDGTEVTLGDTVAGTDDVSNPVPFS